MASLRVSDGTQWLPDIGGLVGPVGPPGPEGPAGADGVQSSDNSITNMVTITQAEHDALSPPDPNTYYVIVG